MSNKKLYYFILFLISATGQKAFGQLANNDFATTLENTSQIINVRVNDYYSTSVYKTYFYNTFGITHRVRTGHGYISIINNISVLYVPDSGFVGNDSFVYSIAKLDKLSLPVDTARVFVTVLERDSIECKADLSFLINNRSNEVTFHGENINEVIPNTTTYQWDFGDNTFCDVENPTHVFPTGKGKVCLTITTTTGCTSRVCDSIYIVNQNCEADFNYSKLNCINCFQFTDLSVGNVNLWKWNFGDSLISYNHNPAHTFPDTGHYNVCLTVVTNTNCTDTKCENVNVPSIDLNTYTLCNSSFNYSLDSVNRSGFKYNFTDYSVGNIKKWQWSFGDGTSDTMKNTSHQYLANGNYEVCLTITTFDGCVSSLSKMILVKDDIPCFADFNNAVSVPENKISFTDKSGGIIESWNWNFGDGIVSNEQNPEHIFLNSGNYNVCLSVVSIDHCTHTSCKQIQVALPSMCEAVFNYRQQPNETIIEFNNISSGNICNVFWNFGDNDTAYAFSPTHRYRTPGLYNVCMQIYTNDDCFDSYCMPVQVNNPVDCQADFTFNRDTFNSMKYHFQDVSVSNINSWLWKFGDGFSSIDQNTNHLYNFTGNYTACLTVRSDENCFSTICKNIAVENIPAEAKAIGGLILAGEEIFMEDGVAVLYKIENGAKAVSIKRFENGRWNFVITNGNYLVYAIPFYNYSLRLNKMYFPTYYGNSIFWQDASTISYSNTGETKNITLLPSSNLYSFYGSGSISGNILLNENSTYERNIFDNNWIDLSISSQQKDLSAAARNMTVLLLDKNNNPISFRLSDLDGIFKFSNLRENKYKIHTEKAGLQTNPVFVDLTNENPNIEEISVLIGSHDITYGISNSERNEMFIASEYPNPFKGELVVNVESYKLSNISITVINSSGQEVLQLQKIIQPGQNKYSIYMDHLSSGIYFIKYSVENTSYFTRKINKL